MSQENIDFRLSRIEIAYNSYLKNPHLYREILINNASKADFRRMLDSILTKHQEEPDVNDKLIFLLMSFNPENPFLLDYSNAIKRAVHNFNPQYKCINLDDVAGSYEISNEAKKKIRDCRLAIVDLTENKPNVYYELGYAHGIQKDCILTVHKNTKPHFYPSGYKIISYESASDLENKLEIQLRGYLNNSRQN